MKQVTAMLRDITENPFEGQPDAELLLIKHKAVELIEQRMKACHMTQSDLAEASGLQQPHISEMLHRKLTRFSIDRVNRVLAVFRLRVVPHYEISEVANDAPHEEASPIAAKLGM